jgi:ABC-type lipoprotein export system ATPase subunit
LDKVALCRNLRKNFGDLKVLKGVDLAIESGEIVAIVGPSGSGKSTLLHLMGLMERPTGGELQLFSRPSADFSDEEAARIRCDKIGFMFQFHHLLPELGVLDNVLMPCRLAGEPLDSSKTRALELLERLEMVRQLHQKPHELSGGEQQRAALARALIRSPLLLLCDEPTGNLDREHAFEVQKLIWSEAHRAGTAVVVVTHNESLAAQAGRILEIKDGTVIEKHR